MEWKEQYLPQNCWDVEVYSGNGNNLNVNKVIVDVLSYNPSLFSACLCSTVRCGFPLWDDQ